MKSVLPRLPRLLSIEDVAKALQVSKQTIRRWITGAELRSHRLCRQIRISEEDLAAFLGRRRA